MITFNKKDLPIVIHGKKGSGASLFSVRLIAALAKVGNPIIFWSAYPMAKDEFRKELGEDLGQQITVIENEDPSQAAVLLKNDLDRIVFIKNFELIPENIRTELLKIKLLIISGDMENVLTVDQILKFPTRILFSVYLGINLPPLEKYEGFMFSVINNQKVKI
jgi:hypothetical protein